MSSVAEIIASYGQFIDLKIHSCDYSHSRSSGFTNLSHNPDDLDGWWVCATCEKPTFLWLKGSLTEMDHLHFFCGGKAAGLLTPGPWLGKYDSAWINITDYHWSDQYLDHDGKRIRIWHYKGEHSHMSVVTEQGMSCLEQVWSEVDGSYHKFNNDNTLTSIESEKLKSYMRALTFSIWCFMKVHYPTVDHIVAEVHRRYVRAQAGDAEYVSPGLGHRKDEMPPPSDYTRTRTVPVTLKHNLSENQITAIKKALTQGFTAEELAGMYGITASVISSL